MINLIIPLYNLAWSVAMPFLRRSPRVSLGWAQRTLREFPEGPFDIWIQAASGGESLLTNMVLQNLATKLPQGKKMRVLATSGTKQGIDSLLKGRDHLPREGNLDIHIAYFPFDAPCLMKKAFARFAPKLAIIVETELWPGFLITAKRNNVPVFLINGRMSEKSYGSYRHFCGFFKKFGPERIWAISPQDGERFAVIFGPEQVELMNNIKFDRIEPKNEIAAQNPIAALFPETAPFVLLGSVRREEEEVVLKTITATLAGRSDIVIGLFPKHIERAAPWLSLLHAAGITAVKRSEIVDKIPPATVIVWDVFGELAGAYALASATFVGGSLVNLGGQNFLEPLVFGLQPIIGPYWKNFAWVGRDIVTSGLVREVADDSELTVALLAAVDSKSEKTEIMEQVRRFFQPRKGGTEQICQQIIDKFHFLENN
ncbi:MAG: 3-deoxy-D-manno-octulosonic acid transferase [Proteobacteria bacterium]|nr:3-deoxy-D-manno-octulosonic acid transferase [Pseudomonadota bacterium]